MTLILVAELFKVTSIALFVNRSRSSVAPRDLIAVLRSSGATCAARDSHGRERLRRAIRFVDRCFPSGPNCYRRVLLEIALDSGAASEPLHFGLQFRGEPKSGHIWLASQTTGAQRYDAEFVA